MMIEAPPEDIISAIAQLYLENYKLRRIIMTLSQELKEIKKEIEEETPNHLHQE